MSTPSAVLAAMLRSDPGRPRLTFYDDTPGPAAGERIELSAKVLANWVNKAANALQDEWDLGPGSRVRLALPPHWRTLYWALAVWSVGATVVVDGAGRDLLVGEDLLVTDDPELVDAEDTPAVLVTLAALARSAAGPVPAGAMDEARELATFGDQFTPWAEPADDDLALSADGTDTAYGSVVPQRNWSRGSRIHTHAEGTGELLGDALAAWAVDGSLVLSRGPGSEAGRAHRLATEGVDLEA